MQELFTLATEAELADLFGSAELAELERGRTHSADDENRMLATLFHWRGDRAASDARLARIVDADYRLTATLSLHECVPE